MFLDIYRRVDQAQRRSAIPWQKAPRDRPLPLSFGQERLWILHQFENIEAAYHIDAAWRLRGPLRAELLETAPQDIVNRHENLRTVLTENGDRVYQQVLHQVRIPLQFHDFRADAEPEKRFRTLMEGISSQAFDLTCGPLLRAHLAQLGREDHGLLLVMHHLISDGWSMDVLLQELSRGYRAALTGSEPDLSELPVQYADFAYRQRRWLESEAATRQAHYWQRQLADLEDMPPLPLDFPRPAAQSFHGGGLDFVLNRQTSVGLDALGRRCEATPFMLLEAAFALLLSRYSQTEEVVIGTPIANRNEYALEPLIGFLVNTVALRNQLGGDPDFPTYLERVKQALLEAFNNGELPFERVVETVQPERDLSRPSIFQVMFILQNAARPDWSLPDLQITPVPPATIFAKFDLSLEMRREADTYSGFFEYNCDLFEAATIARFSRHFQRLLEQLCQAPDQPLHAYGLLDDAERRRQLTEWNQNTRTYPNDRLLPQLCRDQAQRCPDAVAVCLDRPGRPDAHLSYGMLDAAATGLAARLQHCGVTLDMPIGLYGERCLELVIGLLAILKAGGAFVPLNPELPEERLGWQCRDAGLNFIVCAAELPETLPTGTTCLPVAGTARPGELLTPRLLPQHTAYLLYTSGSTGRPKGATNSHGAILNRLQWMQEALELTPSDRVLQKTPISFDVSVWEFLWPLMRGAALVLAAPGSHGDPSRLSRLIATRRISTLHFVPSLLKLFLAEAHGGDCGSLQRVISSGEVLTGHLRDRFYHVLGSNGTRLFNLYGPTEAAIDVTYHLCQSTDTDPGVPIGRPIANTQIYLVGRRGEPLPVSAVGELLIAGVGLARGYHGRPHLTAAAFRPNPFSKKPGARVYRSGDLARFREQGEIEFIGRRDFQIKLRGFRIELGEIEVVLNEAPQVHAATVTVSRTADGDQRLAAYVVPTAAAPAAEPWCEQLREHLRRRLPAYMVPAAIEVLAQLPLSANGKLDRKALPEPRFGPTEHAVTPPRTSLERRLAALWCKLLNLDTVGIHDDFFRLGGHSLTAVQLLARIHGELGLKLPLNRLFEKPTVAELSQLIETLQWAGKPQPVGAAGCCRRDGRAGIRGAINDGSGNLSRPTAAIGSDAAKRSGQASLPGPETHHDPRTAAAAQAS